MQTELLSSSNRLPERREVVQSDTIECCFPSYPYWKTKLPTINDEITKTTADHKRRQWRELFESIDHRTDSTKLWRTIKEIDGQSKHTAKNEVITFTGRPHTSPKLIANSFNRQFTTSKLGKHSSTRRIRHVS